MKACNFIKKRLQHRCFPVSIPKVLGTIFLWNNYSGCFTEIAFDLISLFHIKCKSLQDIQLTREHLSFPQNFIITKYLKQEVDDDRSVCMDERSPCDLSITGDIKIYQCHVIKRWWRYYPQQRSALSTSIMELFLLLQFDNSRSTAIRDKEIFQVIMR